MFTAAAAIPLRHGTLEVDGVRLFYREAGEANAPAILLLHGFPTSSHMYRNLMPLLADRYRLIAPDLPGFGFSDAPARDEYPYTFDNLARTVRLFADELGLRRYVLQVFDYGAPVGFRLAMTRPERITAIVTQNGNAYEEGLSDGWVPLRAYWNEPIAANREALRTLLTPQSVRWQYVHGAPPGSQVAPETYTLDSALLGRPGNMDIQLDLFLDYATNIAMYPQFQSYFRTSPHLLAVWGKNDPFFLAEGARAFRRDIPDAEVHLFDTGHFALETHVIEIGAVIREFLDRVCG
jgi:pimeloyl-ACP methyl ester carboxylesterase